VIRCEIYGCTRAAKISVHKALPYLIIYWVSYTSYDISVLESVQNRAACWIKAFGKHLFKNGLNHHPSVYMNWGTKNAMKLYRSGHSTPSLIKKLPLISQDIHCISYKVTVPRTLFKTLFFLVYIFLYVTVLCACMSFFVEDHLMEAVLSVV